MQAVLDVAVPGRPDGMLSCYLDSAGRGEYAKGMKVIGYVRVSTAGQVEKGVSMAAQEDKVRAWAGLNGAETVEIFVDAGLSGSRADNRPALQRALEAVGKGDALVVYSLSRLARSTRDTLTIAEALQRRGGELVSLSEKIDTTAAAGKMVFRMLAVLGEFERDQVSDRTRSALAFKREHGEKTGGDVPYGFRARSGRLYEVPREQRAIRRMTRMRRQGRTLRAIARMLEAAKVLRKAGARSWHPEAVKRILARTAAGAIGGRGRPPACHTSNEA